MTTYSDTLLSTLSLYLRHYCPMSAACRSLPRPSVLDRSIKIIPTRPQGMISAKATHRYVRLKNVRAIALPFRRISNYFHVDPHNSTVYRIVVCMLVSDHLLRHITEYVVALSASLLPDVRRVPLSPSSQRLRSINQDHPHPPPGYDFSEGHTQVREA